MSGVTTQYKIRISEELAERLDRLSTQYGRKSGNQIAAEVLENYLDFWEQAEMAKLSVIEQQREQLEITQPYMSGRGTKGEVRKVIKDAQARESKKKRNKD